MSQAKKSAQYQVQKGWVLIAINDEFLTRGSRNGTPTIPAITAPVLKTLLQDALKLEQIKAWRVGNDFAEVTERLASYGCVFCCRSDLALTG